MNFLMRLRDELYEAIVIQHPLPQTRDAMVALATRIENARKHRLSAAAELSKEAAFRVRKRSPNRKPLRSASQQKRKRPSRT